MSSVDAQDRGALQEQLNRTGRKLSKAQRAIAEYFSLHGEKAAFMTAAKISEQVGVSESTVVRFACAMGYDGYPGLQKALRDMLRNRLTAVQRVEMAEDAAEEEVLQRVLRADMQNIRRTLEAIDADTFRTAVERLYGARRVYVMGVRSSAPLAQFMGYYLSFLRSGVTVATPGISDVNEQIVRIGGEDLLFGISFPRYSARAIDSMRFARRQGANVIALTDSEASPVGEAADLCLIARSDVNSFVDSLVAPLSVVNALMVAMSLRRKEQLGDYFRMLEDMWSENRVYRT
jgi:DNA-binding MurR/RpiR family transcriptional regulator